VSHYTRTTTRLSSEIALVAALAAMGFPDVECHEQPATLYGYRGDARRDRANVIIRRKHIGGASNDVGFARTPDGDFVAIISEFDARHLDANWLRQLAVEYARATVNEFAAQNGWSFAGTPEVEEDGTVRLTLRRST
jgi:hypothetical protein